MPIKTYLAQRAARFWGAEGGKQTTKASGGGGWANADAALAPLTA